MFSVRTSDGQVLLTFRVTIPQDFTIEKVELKYDASGGVSLASEGTYIQGNINKTFQTVRNIKVYSADSDISSLDIIAYNANIERSSIVKTANTITADFTSYGATEPIRFMVGNVLVAYLNLVY